MRTMQFNTREFNYHDGTFSAEASDFGERFNDLFSKVFDDGSPLPNGSSLLDEGFELVSQRTGRVVKIVVLKCYFNDEGDLTHWEFSPVDCDAFSSLIIFND